MTAAPPRFQAGALVRARGRDWVVLPPGDDPDVLLLRPLGGAEDEVAGLFIPFEGADVSSASLPPPDPAHVGDAVAASLLRDAVRLGFRSAAGPLRALGRIAVEPRPYQLVPLLMALRQDPVRLLIADDVGIGKTIEAALIARELLDRGEIRRLAVLCPPQLCEQWEGELRTKFHIDAVVVRPGAVAGLERAAQRDHGLDLSRTLFEVYPFVVVSIDYIKSDRRRLDFIRTCPELVIVDEAHGVALAGGHGGAQQQRHALVAELAADPTRHLILATATPHSGNQEAFASLIGLLAPDLEPAVAELAFAAGGEARARLARHFVQRRRGDIRQYLETATDFPERLTAERTYKLSPAYRALLERVLAYARELVQNAESLGQFQRRVNWWAALALLRCASSSPAAAAAALRTRARQPAGDDAAVDRSGEALVLDLAQSDEHADDDTTPGVDTIPGDDPAAPERARLLRLAREADALGGAADPKLAAAEAIVRELLAAGCAPVVFCRYIATAHYVAEALAERLKGVRVAVVTGELPPEERERLVEELGAAPKRVLVATDCLSEGVNLQQWFDAVAHYDLAWNPTRHEQREGRVDRYSQPRPQVRTALLYGQDNRVDGVVLEVLLKKAENIRKSLGVAVPVPVDTDKILEAIFDGLFQRGATDYRQLELFVDERRAEVAAAWDRAAALEQRTRTVFAQHALRPEEVAGELRAVRAAIGDAATVRRFVEEATRRLTGVAPAASADGRLLTIELARLPPAVRSRFAGGEEPTLRAGFEPGTPAGAVYVGRTHPFVEALGGYLLDTALDTPAEAVAKRVGAIRTAAVAERTVLLVVRGRYVIHEPRAGIARELLAEEALVVGYTGDHAAPAWLEPAESERLARAALPVANVAPGQAGLWAGQVVEALPALTARLDGMAGERARAILAAHQRVRQAARLRAAPASVEAKRPVDVLGAYILMPAPAAAAGAAR